VLLSELCEVHLLNLVVYLLVKLLIELLVLKGPLVKLLLVTLLLHRLVS
jgi:hypothetical protein